ncbi:MAG: WYL domain-containing protein [Spirochaetes bacterium]|nr:WYL domain-containing protein [Spirochaetota bacterium]
MSQTERLQYIDEQIRLNGNVRIKEIAQKFEVSVRTVKRDIQYLRDRLNAPIQYNSQKKCYEYTSHFDYFAYRCEKNLLFYVFLSNLLESPTHFPFIEKNLIANIKRYIASQHNKIIPKITYQIQEWEKLDIELFSKLITAILKEHSLEIHYEDAKGELTQRTVSPQHFIHYEGRWYFIAFDDRSKTLRIFLLTRIKNCVPSSKTPYKRISDIEIQKFITSNYGIYKGTSKQIVRIRFYEPITHIVKEQIWHSKQTKTTGTHPQYGNYIDLSLPVYHPEELIGKVLRFGQYAEIISPQEIRAMWLKKIEEAYCRFCKKN